MRHTKTFWGIFIAVLVVVIGVGYAFANPSAYRAMHPAPVAATPSAVMGLTTSAYGLHLPPIGKSVVAPAGKQVYEISQKAGILPAIAETVIDPPGVHPGDMQHLEVLVYSPNKITSVYVVSRLDSKEVKIPLSFLHDEDHNGQTFQRYAGDWRVTDTHEQLYMTAFFAEDSAGNVNHVEHAWSDDCNLGVSGNSDMTYSCTLSRLDGQQGSTGSHAIIYTGVTFTIGSGGTFYLSPGNSLQFQGSGALAIQKGVGATIIKADIWVPDGDGDHWPRNGNSSSQGSINQYTSQAACQGAEGVTCVPRASLSTWQSDCDDTNASLTNNCGGGGGGGGGCVDPGCTCTVCDCPGGSSCFWDPPQYTPACGGYGYYCSTYLYSCRNGVTDDSGNCTQQLGACGGGTYQC